MQTSNHKKTSGRIVALLLIMALFLLGNGFLNYVFTPYRGSSGEMWMYYQKAEPEMIYTGSSQCLCGIDPETVDDILRTSSYNMGTNMQSFRSSYVAIRAAVEEKGVRRVVLCVDDEITGLDRTDNFRADASFQRARNANTNRLTAGRETLSFLMDEPVLMHTGSINYFFPWSYDRVTDIGQNIKEKRDKKVYDETSHRMITGREPSEEILEDDLTVIGYEEWEEWNQTAGDLEILSLSADSRKELQKIASYCQEKGVELISITLPYPTAFRLYAPESYQKTVEELTELFSAYGFDYRNFNFAKPSFYQIDLSEYKDTGHFNTKGALRFSQVLAGYLEMSETERSSCFYTTDDF